MPAYPLTLELFTPADDGRPVFVTGNFNGWRTRDEQFRMEKLRDGHYQIHFPKHLQLDDTFEYKYVKGGWESEELAPNGYPPTNRRMEIPRGKVRDVVPKWKTHGKDYNPAFYPDIQVVAKRFNVPQLGRRRRISVLLPHDYAQTDRRYPVLYLQDGQNLFEDNAPYGTWQLDKRLAQLAERGKGNFIVVAIDHGGQERIREFSPYGTLKWGEGLGQDYARFLAETLKPHIDKQFRTLPSREHTAIGGSSMGGLISIFAGMMYPEVYSRFLIFSPSLWLSPRIFTERAPVHPLSRTKIYLYAGGKEGAGMVANAKKLRDSFRQQGLDSQHLDLHLEIDPQGKHHEPRWGQEFPKAVEWLLV